jgi:hypothetical protein
LIAWEVIGLHLANDYFAALLSQCEKHIPIFNIGEFLRYDSEEIVDVVVAVKSGSFSSGGDGGLFIAAEGEEVFKVSSDSRLSAFAQGRSCR